MIPTTEALCPRCKGTGKVVVDEFTHQMCLCLYNRKMSQHLGPELVRAPTVKDSQLYNTTTVKGEEVLVDRTKENLFIKTWWDDLRGHLKWALYCKGLHFSFQVLTDERIRNVYVGNEQYTHRTRKSRDDFEANNSLHDLLGEETDLVILRLGFLGYRNIAMPGALLEALRIREVSLKPTWVIEEPDQVLGPGHFSYSSELWDYIATKFSKVDMVSDPDRVVAPRNTFAAALEDAPGMSLDEGAPESPHLFQGTPESPTPGKLTTVISYTPPDSPVQKKTPPRKPQPSPITREGAVRTNASLGLSVLEGKEKKGYSNYKRPREDSE